MFGNIVWLVVSIAVVWSFLRYVRRRFESISDVRPRTRFLLRTVESTVRILLWFGVLTLAIRLLAPGQNAVLVMLASAAIAVGLGARDLVKNLIGGLVIIADRPYEVGDRVAIAGVTGEIQHIGLGTTKIATRNGTLATIPNSKLLDAITRNANAGTQDCLVATEVFLPADVDLDLALRVGREVLITCQYLRLRRPTEVAISEGLAQAPYLSLKLKGYVYDHRFESEMQTELVRRCKAEFRRLGIIPDHREAGVPPNYEHNTTESPAAGQPH
jgi:small-conductance mechanosensitive channel